MQASSLQASSLPATPQRVTLSDFQRLQQALLETRQALYDSQERESSATAALSESSEKRSAYDSETRPR